MKFLCVTSAGNNSGKTSLLCAICSAFPAQFTAIKGTTIYEEAEGRCPRSEEAGAHCACTTLSGPYRIITDPAGTDVPGSDTGRIAAAGARRTIWCIARRNSTPSMVSKLLGEILRKDASVVTEGNTLARCLYPELRVFVANPRVPLTEIKAESAELLLKADLLVLNSFPPSQGDAGPEEGARNLRYYLSLRGSLPAVEADLSRPGDALDPLMAQIRERFFPPDI